MALLVALIYAAAGALCIQRPERIAAWIGKSLERAGGFEAPPWLRGRGAVLFIRLIGFLALINAAALLYAAQHP